MPTKQRKLRMPERAGKKGYVKKAITKIHPRTHTKFKSVVWVKKK
jgi:hypothetical protein